MLSLRNSSPAMCKKLSKRKNPRQALALFNQTSMQLVKHTENGKVVSIVGDVFACNFREWF